MSYPTSASQQYPTGAIGPDVVQRKALFPAPSTEFLTIFGIASDTAVLVSAFYLGMRPHDFSFLVVIRHILAGPYSSYFLLSTILYQGIFGYLGGYDRKKFLSQSMLSLVFQTSVIWFVCFLALVLALKLQPPISRTYFVWGFLNSWCFLSLWRLILRQFLLQSGWQAALTERVVMVGWSRESHLLAKRMRQDSGHHYEIVGCTPSAHGKFWVTPPREIPMLGDYNSLPEILCEHKPCVAMLADLDPVMGEIIALANLCEREHVQFKVIPSYFQSFSSGLHLEHVSGVPVLGVNKLPLDSVFNRIVKRAFDVIGAIVGLIISAPIILFFGYLIREESPGPIFYGQVRCGQGGRNFRIYKLRSMGLNAESHGAGWTKENDPRRLKIGEVMRRWNIDEVPQFWNVLVGDMSLVGPRPERPEHILRLKEEIPHYSARLHFKPGLTGFAQVHGMRGDTDLTARVRYDLYYLENWSVFLDLMIIIRTFFVRSGAY